MYRNLIQIQEYLNERTRRQKRAGILIHYSMQPSLNPMQSSSNSFQLSWNSTQPSPRTTPLIVTIKTKFIGNIVMWCALFWRPVQMILNWWIGNTVQISLRVACENCITFGNWQEAQTIINSARPSEVSAILVAILAMVARATIVRSPGALHRKAIYKTVPFARRREWL